MCLVWLSVSFRVLVEPSDVQGHEGGRFVQASVVQKVAVCLVWLSVSFRMLVINPRTFKGTKSLDLSKQVFCSETEEMLIPKELAATSKN